LGQPGGSREYFRRLIEGRRTRPIRCRGLANALQEPLADVRLWPGGNAEAWYPRKPSEPNVIVNPKMAFGQSVIEKYGVPTKVLFDAFNAEGGSYESVAYWFDVAEEDVKEAVRFEVSLPSAHENRV
jgi:uncharacterized protein (DUF433 family)